MAAVEMNERRIVLVGKTGVGKSAAGNTILKREAFESELSSSSVTSNCHKASGKVDGRSVAVIDTPGLFDTNLSHEDVLNRIKMCFSMCAPGPHAFLVVLQVGRFTQEEKDTIQMIQTTFGEDAVRYTMVLFTHGDRLKKKTIKNFISESPDLQAVIDKCSNRYHVFNNEDKDLAQVSQLLEKIDKMMMANNGSHYTNEMFMTAEEAIQKEKKRLLNQMEDKKKKEKEELIKDIEKKMQRENEVVMKNMKKKMQQLEKMEQKKREKLQKQMEEQKQREMDALEAKYSEVRRREENLLNMRYQQEARARAEMSNDFIVSPLAGLVNAAGTVIGTGAGLIGAGFNTAVNTAEKIVDTVSDNCVLQ